MTRIQEEEDYFVNKVMCKCGTHLFPLETPLRLSRNMLHGWKDNSMLAKPLAAYTYLS